MAFATKFYNPLNFMNIAMPKLNYLKLNQSEKICVVIGVVICTGKNVRIGFGLITQQPEDFETMLYPSQYDNCEHIAAQV